MICVFDLTVTFPMQKAGRRDFLDLDIRLGGLARQRGALDKWLDPFAASCQRLAANSRHSFTEGSLHQRLQAVEKSLIYVTRPHAILVFHDFSVERVKLTQHHACASCLSWV